MPPGGTRQCARQQKNLLPKQKKKKLQGDMRPAVAVCRSSIFDLAADGHEVSWLTQGYHSVLVGGGMPELLPWLHALDWIPTPEHCRHTS